MARVVTDHARTVVTVNSADQGGGAERVARQQHAYYLANGEDAWFAVGERLGSDDRTIEVPNRAARSAWARAWQRVADALPGRGIGGRMARVCRGALAEPARWRARKRGLEDFDQPGTAAIPGIGGRRADVLHLHNLHGRYFDLRMLPTITAATPTLITLHDAWLLSGHCAHSFECERWMTGCGACPYLWTHPAIPKDGTAENWRLKRALLARSRLWVGVPCEWLADRVRRSIVAPAVIDLRVIPHGVDLALYAPADRRAARLALGLDPDRQVFVCHENALRDRTWKDGAQFCSALARVGDAAAGAQWIAVGAAGPDRRIGAVTVRCVDHVRDVPVMARWLQAADAYVHPARADTAPLSVLESLACGTPVIATAIGGIPEQVRSGGIAGAIENAGGERPTGALVPGGDAAALAAVLDAFSGLSAEQHRALGSAARTDAERRFDSSRHEREYLEWMRTIAAAGRGDGSGITGGGT